MATVFMFSGQGSQYYGMGRELYQREAVFRRAMDRLDEIAADAVGESVLARMYEPGRGRAERFDATVLTHPAIVMVELALAELLMAEGVVPDVLLGASLGEFTAAVLAGVITEAECLRVLVGQARALAGLPAGGMLAVLAEPDWHERGEVLRARTDLAAINFAGHFVLSGADADLAAAEEFLLRNDITVQRVPVGYAFHSRLMDARRDACLALLDGIHPKPPTLRLVSCATAGEVTTLSAEHFWRVTRQQIRFSEAVLGLETEGPHRYLDLGPAGTLHNFVRNLLPSASTSRSFPLLSPFSTDTSLLTEVRSAVRPVPADPKGDAMLVYGFPGQGSQLKGMGAGMFDEFAEHTATADRVLGYSVRDLCLDNPDDRLRRTQFTQPALYVVEALDYLHRRATGEREPDYLVGHSVGEYAALFAAGAFDFETGLRMVRRRGELMAAAGGGTMAAVIGCAPEKVAALLAEAGVSTVDIANLNAPDQIVVAGPESDIERVRPLFEGCGAHFVRLRVSAPFHSRYMRPVMDEFAAYLATLDLRDPQLPVIANTDARPYRPGTIRDVLVRQIGSPVQWLDTVRYLMGRAQSSGADEFEFAEVGPGKVLTKLVTKIRQQATPLVVPVEPVPVEPVSAEPVPGVSPAPDRLRAAGLGAAGFQDRYGLRYAYVAGALCHGISGTDLVLRLARAGGMGVFGTEGLSLTEVGIGLRTLRESLGPDGPFAANLLYHHADPDRELALVDLFLRLNVRVVEASGFLQLTPALVKYRLRGGRILATVSRADMAEMFLSPPPQRVVRRLLDEGHVTQEQADAAARRPVADDLCVAADGGWVAGAGSMSTVLPTVLRLRDRLAGTGGAAVHVGAAGGIGTPEAVAAAFLLGADFVLTGSVNQCTVEAATSPAVKDLLSQLDVHDVDSAPWPEMFELGVRANVVKRSVFFPARANKLYELWRRYESLADLDAATRQQVAEVFLGLPAGEGPIGAADLSGKQQLVAVFRAYVDRGMRFALTGDAQHRVDYLVYCGSAMGAFNQWVRGTDLEHWQARHVDVVAERLMAAASALLVQRCARFVQQPTTTLPVPAQVGSRNGSTGGNR